MSPTQSPAYNSLAKHQRNDLALSISTNLAPPRTTCPETPLRRQGQGLSSDISPTYSKPLSSDKVPRIETSCADCTGDEFCPLHDSFGGESNSGLYPSDDRQIYPLSQHKSRPKLRLQTSGKVTSRQYKVGETVSTSVPEIGGLTVERKATDESNDDFLPSSSTLRGSGSTPGLASKKWDKVVKTVKFAAPDRKIDETPISTPTRPLLPRDSSNLPSKGSERLSARKKMQRLFHFSKYRSDDSSTEGNDYIDRHESHIQTPLHLPRRISRLPSFFTRERLILPQRAQRRDYFLISIASALSVLFVTIGILAATVPEKLCEYDWLATAIDSFLPTFAISTPYTFIVVAFAVSGTGRNWINGRYTPMLYALVAALGRVAIGALSGNVTWKVMNCPDGSA